MGTDLLGRRADNRLGRPRLDAGPSRRRTKSGPCACSAKGHGGRCARAAGDRRRSPLPSPPAGAVAPKPPRVQTLEINKSHNGQLARLRVGNMLVIRLPGNPATGYQWQAAATNSPAMKPTVRPQYSAPAAQAASGTYTFTYQAVQPGSGSIRLYYVRPDDPTRPRDSFAVSVSVSPAAAAAIPAASRRE